MINFVLGQFSKSVGKKAREKAQLAAVSIPILLIAQLCEGSMLADYFFDGVGSGVGGRG